MTTQKTAEELKKVEQTLPEDTKSILEKGRKAIRANKKYLEMTQKATEKPRHGNSYQPAKVMRTLG